MAIDKDLLLVIESAGLGQGEPDLGEKLMKAFLTMLLESGTVPAKIICMTGGIFLTTEGSPVLDILKRFEREGCSILSCLTCLEYYGRKEKLKVGTPTTMRDTVSSMLTFRKILKP
jgi:selenium metabolism protein YedF